MNLRRAWLAFIARTLNRVTLRLARRGRGPFWVIRTTGRRSGLPRETPIVVARDPEGFVIELTYGPSVQWYRNLVAAEGAVLERGGRRWEVGSPERIPTERGLAAFSPAQQRVLRRLHREHYELLRPTGRTWRRTSRGIARNADPARNSGRGDGSDADAAGSDRRA